MPHVAAILDVRVRAQVAVIGKPHEGRSFGWPLGPNPVIPREHRQAVHPPRPPIYVRSNAADEEQLPNRCQTGARTCRAMSADVR